MLFKIQDSFYLIKFEAIEQNDFVEEKKNRFSPFLVSKRKEWMKRGKTV